jgi:hypothetical protein
MRRNNTKEGERVGEKKTERETQATRKHRETEKRETKIEQNKREETRRDKGGESHRE